MVLPIFPTSPLWANITREPLWMEEVFWYDSGARQASSPWVRPLYRYSIPAVNYSELKQNSLHQFWNNQKGMTTPFLMKDPYAYITNSMTQPTSTNMGIGSGFYFIEQNSWRVIPDSAFLAISDPRSGLLTASIHYVLSQDNGFCRLLATVSSIWVASFQFFRKAAFDQQFAESSPIWNVFNSNIRIRELLPNI